jgi:hypothetical protein
MRMNWSLADDARVEQRLRALLTEGQSLEQAIRTLHEQDGYGALLLCPSVERVAEVSAAEAKQLVVRALFPLWYE